MFGNYSEIIDVSRPLYNGMPVYPGNDGFKMSPLMRMPADWVDLSEITAGLHVGTHVDSPSHFVDGGERIDEVPLKKFMGEAWVLDFSDFEGTLLPLDLVEKKCEGKDLSGKIVLIKTRNSLVDPTVFHKDFVGLSGEVAEFFVSSEIKAIGVDGPSVDEFDAEAAGYPSHYTFLGAGCIAFETLILKDAEEGQYFFIGLPLKLKDVEASMVRAVLLK